jgi:hypothetical protein
MDWKVHAGSIPSTGCRYMAEDPPGMPMLKTKCRRRLTNPTPLLPREKLRKSQRLPKSTTI